MIDDPTQFLRRLFDRAVAAADPKLRVPAFLPERPKGRTIVLGAGKASAAMARATEEHYGVPLNGLVVTRYGHAVKTRSIEIVEAAHPVPDENGRAGAARMLDFVRDLTPDDLVLCLISGGGSALTTLPADGISLAEMQALTSALLKSGATIHEMNCVRKHLSRFTGGRLAAAAHPAKVVTLAISDVPGDDPAVIASGPTVPDPTTRAQAQEILARYHIDPPQPIAARLADAACESPKPGDPRLAGAVYHMIASPKQSLEAAAAMARESGVTPIILGDAIEGFAQDVGRDQARTAIEFLRGNIALPSVILSGGETTVLVRGNGRGGRNTEYLLALTLALNGRERVYALAADTDGIDGTEDNAGAVTTPGSLSRAEAFGLDAAAMLENNDGYSFFAKLGDLVVSGPTLTNVNDFRAILLLPPGE
ncbi:MAG TPA: glycerate kinase [Alphaproteobacteria bacterium]|nr:glycerate kinase [Alphaproteobacteria bacterium]